MNKVYCCFPGGKHKALTMSYDDGRLEDRRLIEIFKILTCQHERRFLFAHTFERISDVLDGDGVGKPDIQFVQRRDGVALGQQLV